MNDELAPPYLLLPELSNAESLVNDDTSVCDPTLPAPKLMLESSLNILEGIPVAVMELTGG
jgi:hypothetical protein